MRRPEHGTRPCGQASVVVRVASTKERSELEYEREGKQDEPEPALARRPVDEWRSNEPGRAPAARARIRSDRNLTLAVGAGDEGHRHRGQLTRCWCLFSIAGDFASYARQSHDDTLMNTALRIA